MSQGSYSKEYRNEKKCWAHCMPKTYAIWMGNFTRNPVVYIKVDFKNVGSDLFHAGSALVENQGWISDMNTNCPNFAPKVAFCTNLGQNLSQKVGVFLIFYQII